MVQIMSRSLSIVAFVLLRSGQQHLVLSKQTQSGNDTNDVKSLVVHDKQSQSEADAEEFRKVAGSAGLFFEDMRHANHNGMNKEQLSKMLEDGRVVMDNLKNLFAQKPEGSSSTPPTSDSKKKHLRSRL